MQSDILLDNRFIAFVNAELAEVNKELPAAFKFRKNKGYRNVDYDCGPGNKDWKSSPIIQEWAEKDAELLSK
jgi:hypothetical protein